MGSILGTGAPRGALIQKFKTRQEEFSVDPLIKHPVWNESNDPEVAHQTQGPHSKPD